MLVEAGKSVAEKYVLSHKKVDLKLSVYKHIPTESFPVYNICTYIKE